MRDLKAQNRQFKEESNLSAEFKEKLAEIEAEIPNSKLAKELTALKAGLAGRPLILYGAGQFGGAMLDLCKDYGIAVTRACDRIATGTLNGEVKIIDPQTLQREFPNAIILVCSLIYSDEICDTLRKLGFQSEQIVQCPIEYP
jgi:hypothetical protein